MAANITITLNEQEQAAFQQLLDLALRNAGMNVYAIVSHFVALLTGTSRSNPDGLEPDAKTQPPLTSEAVT